MPYASLQDVRDLAPHVTINAQSQPSEGTVLRWISDIEISVDATLQGIGYQTPITGAAARVIVRDIVAHLVMARVMRGRPNPETDPGGFETVGVGLLKRLRDPKDPLELVGAVQLDTPIKEGRTRVSSNLKDLTREDPELFATRRQVF